MSTIVDKATRKFIACIDEDDFDRIHKVTDSSVYGFVDRPPILPLIITVIKHKRLLSIVQTYIFLLSLCI